LGGSGNLLGVIAGVQPRLTASTVAALPVEDASLHLEGFYKIQLGEHLAIVPGVIWVNDPGNDNENDDVFIGAIKTVFSF
jgi:carbohydrate-selective porin OprB